MKVRYIKTADITPYERNAKKHPKHQVEQIAESLRMFGWQQPLVIDRDGVIVIGHGRFMAAELLEQDEVPCLIADELTDEQIRMLRLADNKLNESDWDMDLLAEELEGLDFGDLDLDWGIDLQEDVPEIVEDTPPDPPAVPRTKYGEIYQLGDHRLMCGDSTDAGELEKLLGGAKIDLVITDPPYNVNYARKTRFLASQGRGKGQQSIENDDMDSESFYEFLLDAFENMAEVMRTGAAVYVFHSDTNGLIFRRAFTDSGLWLSECLIWEKNSLVLGRSDYQWIHEPILYGWKEGQGHYFVDDRTQITVIAEDPIDYKAMKKAELVEALEEIRRSYRTTVLQENKPMKNDIHPTMKPVALIARLIKNSSKTGWTVLDIFGGSGSTLMAAEQLGRTAYIMELDPGYCDVIIDRWEEFTGGKAVRIE